MKKIYLAGGWFTPEMEEEHTRVYNAIKNDFNVFNPRLESLVDENSTNDHMTQTLIGNVENIKNADIVLVIYDYKDTGTIWEAGFAYANKKPIIYYAEKLNGKPFNLMLAKTGNFVDNIASLVTMLNTENTFKYKDVYNSYVGRIE